MSTTSSPGLASIAANFAAVGAHLAAATMVVAINGWSVVAMTEQDTGLCIAYLNHPTLSDPRSGQPFGDSQEVRAYALSRGYLRWYRPGEGDDDAGQPGRRPDGSRK